MEQQATQRSAIPEISLTKGREILLTARATALVFAASSVTLVLELVASRMLSPFVGVSLYTWTSVIGVILAGISLGNWLGGKLADARPDWRTATMLFLVGAASTGSTPLLVGLLGDGSLVRPLPLLLRTFLLTSLVFLLPSLVLSAVTPVIIRLCLRDVARAGSFIGLIYAVGTLGSLVGNYLTGFVLLAQLPVNTIVLAVSAALLFSVPLTFGLTPVKVLANDSTRQEKWVGTALPQRTRSNGLCLPGNISLACIVVATVSFLAMSVEMAASRVLAPYVGVSLFSWTGIIGVVLAGIAIGNYLGGCVADRWPRQWVLGLLLLLSGFTSLAILWTAKSFAQQGAFNGLGLMERIVALTTAIFFLPVLLLGTISPQVIKLVMKDLGQAGRISGRVYAWSTFGAIVGTFATGWFLISLLGVKNLILLAGLSLTVMAIAVGRFWRQAWAIAPIVIAVASLNLWLKSAGALEPLCTVETNYFCIKVYEENREGAQVKALVLDHLIHSYVKIGDPSFLGYEHEQVQAEMARLVAARTASPRILVIGGGGYTFPRWVEAFLPQAIVEVVEIDPGVTETAYQYLGLPRETRIISYNLDGRQFVSELAESVSYDLIVQDAVNDLSVPYHILTKEYNDRIRKLLKDGGIYLLTVIDLYEDGQLMRAAARTLMQTFPNVQILGPRKVWENPGSSVFVVYGSDRPFDANELHQALRRQGITDMRTIAQPEDQLRAYVATGPQIVLTDQYAPVDNLISLLFKSRN